MNQPLRTLPELASVAPGKADPPTSLRPLEAKDFDSVVSFILSNKFTLNKYGFDFKEATSLTDSTRQVRDLWAWLKKLQDLRKTAPEQAEILFDLKRYLDQSWGHQTETHRNYAVLAEKLVIFDTLGWQSDLSAEFERQGTAGTNNKPSSPEFARKVCIYALHFRFLKASEELEKALAAKDSVLDRREARFVCEHLKLFHEFHSQGKADFGSFEYRAIVRSVQSMELETPYFRLIQVFLAKSFLSPKETVINMPGVNFFDRLLFVLRFQYKQGPELIGEYMRAGKEAGNLDCLALYTGSRTATTDLIEQYLKLTGDTVTVGMAAILFGALYNWTELDKHVERMLSKLAAKNEATVAIVNKEQLRLRKEMRAMQAEERRDRPNVAFACYYCKKEPGRLEEATGFKSNCGLKRRPEQPVLFGAHFISLRQLRRRLQQVLSLQHGDRSQEPRLQAALG